MVDFPDSPAPSRSSFTFADSSSNCFFKFLSISFSSALFFFARTSLVAVDAAGGGWIAGENGGVVGELQLADCCRGGELRVSARLGFGKGRGVTTIKVALVGGEKESMNSNSQSIDKTIKMK